MRRILIIGLDRKRWETLRQSFAGYEDAPQLIAVGGDERETLIKDLVASLPQADSLTPLPEAGRHVIVFFAGFTGRESSYFIDQTRGLFGPDVIFAGLTATNAGWTLAGLVRELVAERAEFIRRAATGREGAPDPE